MHVARTYALEHTTKGEHVGGFGGLVARRWTSSGCGVDHAAPCADDAALPPRALWGTSGGLARVGVSLIFVASLN